MSQVLKTRQGTEGAFFSFRAVGKGLLFAFVVYFLFAILLASVIFFRSSLEARLTTLSAVAGYSAVLVGALVSGRRAGRSGWLHGIFTGCLFILLSYYLGIVFWPTQAGAVGFMWRRLIIGVVTGLLGGVLGANL